MGGGTGTGAAPVIAKAAREARAAVKDKMLKEKKILTVGVVTKPFDFEGVRQLPMKKTTFADAFRLADNVLHIGIRGVTDLMVMPGLINLDFADIGTVMNEMGKAMIGTGEAEGEDRAVTAAEAAISNPLLDNMSMKGAQGILINITGGEDMTLFEVDAAANRVREEVDEDANIIFGATFDQAMEGKVRVSVLATGIDNSSNIRDGRVETSSVSQTKISKEEKFKWSYSQASVLKTKPAEQSHRRWMEG
ncbi:unnamed protein product [Ceratitis capitata]|uniref:(Mediterranean fruit fly) hypothetical protein n=1 Tax=Ceratitis capitata TaxID=7213 RepID=A0A811VAG1_CERCA|nr:unnamed protein product [Ceratitis capitata]